MSFSTIPAYTPKKSVFNLTDETWLNCDMGELIPIFCKRMMPGDVFKTGQQVVIRFQPLVAPLMHEINVYCHYFFVPERLLFTSYDSVKGINTNDDNALQLFLTGGVNGDDDSVSLPKWTGVHNTKFTIWDYLGLPLTAYDFNPANNDGVKIPNAFPKRAYNKVYNDFYRDETLQAREVDLDQETILHRNWKKDYFTSALPWQQRGQTPALPVSGFSPLFMKEILPYSDSSIPSKENQVYLHLNNPDDTPTLIPNAFLTNYSFGTNKISFMLNNSEQIQNSVAMNGSLGVDFSNATTFDVSDLRLSFQIQKWLERNARGGIRYNEFLLSHYGVAPRDETLQRAVYVGGTKAPVITSEVIQTSSTDSTSPQGNLAGKALGANAGYVGAYRAKEFGWMLGIMSVVPMMSYSSQGLPRDWCVDTRYEYPFPEFVSLSEQAVLNQELFFDATTPGNNAGIFGYQGRFDEFRHGRTMVAGDLRDTLAYWHLGRIFGNAPALNADFIEMKPTDFKRIFAVQDEKGLVVHVSSICKGIRPLPRESVPGLIDHH